MDKDEFDNHVKMLAEWLASEAGRKAMKEAGDASRKRMKEIEKASRITDPLFFFKRVTI